MIHPIPGQQLPSSKHSRTKILFRCDCGREKAIVWKNYTSNHTKSCGLCRSDKFKLENIVGKKFGLLTLQDNQNLNTLQKRTELIWKCECGNYKKICLASVVNGLTKSCGCMHSKINREYKKPILISKDIWLKQFPNIIDSNLPDAWSKYSAKIFQVQCSCGNIYNRKFCKLTEKSTCNRCKHVKINDLNGQRFGKLICCDDRDISIHLGGEQLVKFKCDCGNHKNIKIGAVTRGYTTSCSDCNLRDTHWWLSQKFGHLRVLTIKESLKLNSEQEVQCICSCGNQCNKRASELTSGHVRTCGSCYERVARWYETHTAPPIKINGVYSLKSLQQYFNNSFIEPLESTTSVLKPTSVKCKLCGTIYKTKLQYFYANKVVSCGCIGSGQSRQNIEIGKFIESSGLIAHYGKHETTINGHKYDIVVPQKKLIIEHNGLRYHSDKLKSNNIDYLKFLQAKEAGYNYLMIYEDEWETKKDIFKDIIMNKIGFQSPQYRIRPQQCVIKLVDGHYLNKLLQKFHYIGRCSASLYIGVHYNNELIAGITIKRPTRQNSGDWEISRMICDYRYRIFGLWSYIIKWLAQQHLIYGNLFTYSDNRISNGDVYRKMGFTNISSVRPDYYWVKNNRRFHKSALRKTETEKATCKTESELRMAQGYQKIFDLGKLKWSINI